MSCKESPCYCAETGNGPCMHCHATTCQRREWDEDSFLCDACYCAACEGRKTAECDSCNGHGSHTSGDSRGPDYRESNCSQCDATGRVACPECCQHSPHGRDAASLEDAVVARYEARLAAANY